MTRKVWGTEQQDEENLHGTFQRLRDISKFNVNGLFDLAYYSLRLLL